MKYLILICFCLSLGIKEGWTQDWKNINDQPPIVDSLYNTAVENEPQLKCLTEEFDKQKTQVKLTKKSWLENFSFGIQLFSRPTNFDGQDASVAFVPSLGVNFSVNLYGLMTTGSRVRQSENDLNQSAFKLQQREIELRQEIESKYIDYQMEVEKMKNKQQELENMNQHVDLMKTKYKNGEISMYDYMMMEKEQVEVENELLEIRANMLKIESELRAITNTQKQD